MMAPIGSGWRTWSDQFTDEAIVELQALEGSTTTSSQPASNVEPKYGIHRRLKSDAEGELSEVYVHYDKFVSGLRHKTNIIEFLMKMVIGHDPRALTMVKGIKNVSLLLTRYEDNGLCYYGLTVLALSILFRREDLSLAIINRIQTADLIDVKDKSGWTPLHHAVATTQKSVVKALKEKGANKNAPDNQGLTPSILKKLTSITKEDETFQVYFRVPGETEDRLILASTLVKDYGHLFSEKPKRFLPHAKVSKKAIYDYWKRNNEGWCSTTSIDCDWMCALPPQKDIYQFKFIGFIDLISHYSSESRKRRLQLPNFNPSVALRVITHDGEGNELKMNLGVGVYARQNISKGDLACYYGGKIGLYKSSRYALESNENYVVCAKKNRGLGSCVAHSYPNAFFARSDSVLLSNNVKPGEMIAVIYEKIFKADEPVLELRSKAMEDFTRSNNYTVTNFQLRYIEIISPRSILIFYLKGLYRKEGLRNESDDTQKCINLCSELHQNNPKLALALAQNLIYQSYTYMQLTQALNQLITQIGKM